MALMWSDEGAPCTVEVGRHTYPSKVYSPALVPMYSRPPGWRSVAYTVCDALLMLTLSKAVTQSVLACAGAAIKRREMVNAMIARRGMIIVVGIEESMAIWVSNYKFIKIMRCGE